MATVTVTFFRPAQYEGFGVIGNVSDSETLTSAGTSGASTASAEQGDIARVTVSGGNVHVTKGTSPTATTDDALLVDGTTEYFACVYGDKVAIIDAA